MAFIAIPVFTGVRAIPSQQRRVSIRASPCMVGRRGSGSSVPAASSNSLSRRTLLSNSALVALAQLLPLSLVQRADAKVDIDLDRFGDKGMLFLSFALCSL